MKNENAPLEDPFLRWDLLGTGFRWSLFPVQGDGEALPKRGSGWSVKHILVANIYIKKGHISMNHDIINILQWTWATMGKCLPMTFLQRL